MVLARGKALLLTEAHHWGTRGYVFHLGLRQTFEYVHLGEAELLPWSLFNHCATVLPWFSDQSAIAETSSADLPTRRLDQIASTPIGLVPSDLTGYRW